MGIESEAVELAMPVEEKTGEVKIANEVVAAIAALAATEIKGVASLIGNMTYETISKCSSKNLSRSVSVAIDDGVVSVHVYLVMEYGYSVPVVSAKVQDRVKSAIENMTGMQVSEVKITVAGVNM